jgi:hypothetical protein
MIKVNAAVQGMSGSGDHANADTQDAQQRGGGMQHPSTRHIKMGRANFAHTDRTAPPMPAAPDPSDALGGM